MDLFTLAAKLTLDSSSFNSGISNAEKAGKSLGDSLQNSFGKVQKIAAAVLSGAAIKKGIDTLKQYAAQAAAAGDKIDKQSQALGLSRKAYQEWDYILSQNGASIDSMSVSMKTLNSAILSATDGSEEYNAALVKLGLNYVELGDLSMEDQFESVVRAFQQMPAGAQKSALAVKLFGRNGMELLPLLNNSATSIDELRAKAEELGLIMSDDAVDASVAYTDALDTMQRTFDSIRYAVGAKVLPVLTTGMQKVANFAGRLGKAFKEKGLTGVFDALGHELSGFIEKLKSSDSPVLQVLGASLEAVKSVFDWIVANKEIVIGAVGGIIAAFAVTNIITFVTSLNPLTVVFTLIAAAIGLVAANWDKIKDWIGKAWDTTVNFLSEGWDAVKSAFDTIGAWVGEKATQIKLAFTATMDSVLKKIDDWLTGTGIKDFTLNVGATLAGWAETIGGWLSGDASESFTLNIGATVSDWIGRIYNWWKHGIKVGISFFSNAFSGSQGSYSVGDQTYADPMGAANGLSLDSPIPVPGFTPIGSHASGLGSVPYDGYLARLHRGERVLTASQVRQGGNGGIDLTGLGEIVRQAISAGMQNTTVRSYISGRDVTEDVNRNQIRALKARRFAT